MINQRLILGKVDLMFGNESVQCIRLIKERRKIISSTKSIQQTTTPNQDKNSQQIWTG